MRGTIGLCRASWLGVGSAMLLACSSNDTSTIAGRADAGLSGQTPAGASVAAETISRIRERFSFQVPGDPRAPNASSLVMESALGPSLATTFRQEGSGLVPEIPRKILDRTERPARVAAPRRANAPMVLSDEKTGMTLEVTLEGATDAPAEVVDGFVAYRGALDGADVILRARADGVEDYISVDRMPSENEVRYSVHLAKGVAGLRLVGDVLEFTDGDNGPILRMAQPWVVGADGVRHEAHVQVRGCKYDASPVSPWGRAVTPPGGDHLRGGRAMAGWGEVPGLDGSPVDRHRQHGDRTQLPQVGCHSHRDRK